MLSARDYGATVTGITLSTEQLAEAQARAEAEGLADRVSFQLLDYRAADRSFDRVVSVGRFKHVGVLTGCVRGCETAHTFPNSRLAGGVSSQKTTQRGHDLRPRPPTRRRA